MSIYLLYVPSPFPALHAHAQGLLLCIIYTVYTVVITLKKSCSYCQAAVMISLIWKYYSDPVTVVPSRWIAPVERLVAFPTGIAGE